MDIQKELIAEYDRETDGPVKSSKPFPKMPICLETPRQVDVPRQPGGPRQ